VKHVYIKYSMLRTLAICLLIIPILLADDTWKTKRAADWSEAETKQVLTASPWGVMVTPEIKKVNERQPGNRGGLNVGGLGAGIPGAVRHPRGQPTQDPNENNQTGPESGLSLNVRWESALPIREAELKARETAAPDVDENHYAIAVYGLPTRLAKPDAQSLGDHLKGQASIKREGQKELKPTSVQVIQRENDLVIVFLFPRSKEITAKDTHADFEAQIGPYQSTQSFHLDEMIYQGKTEL
jgi:hypothetical protein